MQSMSGKIGPTHDRHNYLTDILKEQISQHTQTTVEHINDTLLTKMGKLTPLPKLKARTGKVDLALSQKDRSTTLHCCFPVVKTPEGCHVGQQILKIYERCARDLQS